MKALPILTYGHINGLLINENNGSSLSGKFVINGTTAGPYYAVIYQVQFTLI